MSNEVKILLIARCSQLIALTIFLYRSSTAFHTLRFAVDFAYGFLRI